jgi:hypothetical protein
MGTGRAERSYTSTPRRPGPTRACPLGAGIAAVTEKEMVSVDDYDFSIVIMLLLRF